MNFFGLKGVIVAIGSLCLASMFMVIDVYAECFTQIIIEENKYNDIYVDSKTCSIEIFDMDYEGIVTRTRRVEITDGNVWLIQEFIGTEGIVKREIYTIRADDIQCEPENPAEGKEEGEQEPEKPDGEGEEEGEPEPEKPDGEGKEEGEPESEKPDGEGEEEGEPEPEKPDGEGEEEGEPETENTTEELEKHSVYIPIYVPSIVVPQEKEDVNVVVPVQEEEDIEAEEKEESITIEETKVEEIIEEEIPKIIKPIPEPKYEEDIIEIEEKVVEKKGRNKVLVIEDDVIPMASTPKTGDCRSLLDYLYLMLGSLLLIGVYVNGVENQRKVEESKVRSK